MRCERGAWDRIDLMPCSGARNDERERGSERVTKANVKEDSRPLRHLSTGEGNARTCSRRRAFLPRHDPVEVTLVEEGGGVAAAVAAPVQVVATLVAVAAAGAGGVAALAAAHGISRTQIWRG